MDNSQSQKLQGTQLLGTPTHLCVVPIGPRLDSHTKIFLREKALVLLAEGEEKEHF